MTTRCSLQVWYERYHFCPGHPSGKVTTGNDALPCFTNSIHSPGHPNTYWKGDFGYVREVHNNKKNTNTSFSASISKKCCPPKKQNDVFAAHPRDTITITISLWGRCHWGLQWNPSWGFSRAQTWPMVMLLPHTSQVVFSRECRNMTWILTPPKLSKNRPVEEEMFFVWKIRIKAWFSASTLGFRFVCGYLTDSLQIWDGPWQSTASLLQCRTSKWYGSISLLSSSSKSKMPWVPSISGFTLFKKVKHSKSIKNAISKTGNSDQKKSNSFPLLGCKRENFKVSKKKKTPSWPKVLRPQAK